jgi:two-component system, sensor histidine kinase LadS
MRQRARETGPFFVRAPHWGDNLLMRFLAAWGLVLWWWVAGATAGLAQVAPVAAAPSPVSSAAAVPSPPAPADAAPAAPARVAAADFATIALSPRIRSISLAGRSRFWVDPTGFRGVDQVESSSARLPWAIVQRGHRYTLADKALWIQFDAIGTPQARFLLEIGSSSVEEAQLFYRDENGRWVQQEAGSERPVSEWPMPGRYPTFELSALHGQPVRYWVRIEQEHVEFGAPMRLVQESPLLASREQAQFLFGAYFGLVGLIALGSLANAAVHRDRNFGVFSLYVIVLAVGQLAAFGLGEQHLWDGASKWNGSASFLLPGISSAAALWFARNITEPARFSRWLDLAVWSVIAALLSAAALDTVLASSSSLLLLTVATLVGLVVLAGLVALALTHAEDPHIGLIAVGFVPILLMGLLTSLSSLDLVPPSPLTRDGLPLGGAIGLPLLFYALSLRTSHRREAQLRAAGLTRHDVLTGIAHDRTLLQRLQGAIDRARELQQQCALMVLNISNFDALVEEFGRDTADRALVVAASLLRRAATDIDLEARVGEHHFALLLEGPATAEHAMNRAQELVARGLRSSTALPAAATIKFHVAVALLPHEQLDAVASLRWLLEGVNAMPPDVRKLIRPMNF